MKTLFLFVKTHKILMVILVLVLAVVVYVSQQKPASPFETVLVAKGTVTQEVSVTGRVNSDSEVSLSFEKSGRVSSTPIPVGTHVSGGDVLARIDASELTPLRQQALANLEVEQANLASLKKGNREEDIAVTRAQVESATSALDQARLSVFDRLQTAYSASDDAIFNVSDQFFLNARTRNPEVNFPVTDAKLSISLPQGRFAIGETIALWPAELASFESSEDTAPAINTTKAHLGAVKSFLDEMALAVNALAPSSNLTQLTIDGWKMDISGARTSINTSVSNVYAVAEKYYSTVEAQKIAENQLALKIAGPTAEAIAAQEARIASVRASIANYDAQMKKTMLIAPFSGVVTKQDAKLGQTVSPAAPIVTLMSDAEWKIETNVPEVDVAKIAIGDQARVTFDAYGTDVLFTAKVVAIDPAETIIEGVSTYKVTLLLTSEDDRVLSGMTANIDILTDKREEVLMIPFRAVVNKTEGKFVRIPSADGLTASEVSVELGLRGSDGNVEVQRGLSLGQRVVIYEKK